MAEEKYIRTKDELYRVVHGHNPGYVAIMAGTRKQAEHYMDMIQTDIKNVRYIDHIDRLREIHYSVVIVCGTPTIRHDYYRIMGGFMAQRNLTIYYVHINTL